MSQFVESVPRDISMAEQGPGTEPFVCLLKDNLVLTL